VEYDRANAHGRTYQISLPGLVTFGHLANCNSLPGIRLECLVGLVTRKMGVEENSRERIGAVGVNGRIGNGKSFSMDFESA
jgi:hypothetical protein